MREVTAAALLLAPSLAFASATAIGPFVGDDSDSWEGRPFAEFLECRDFGAASETCASGSGLHTTGSWGFRCTIYPT